MQSRPDFDNRGIAQMLTLVRVRDGEEFQFWAAPSDRGDRHVVDVRNAAEVQMLEAAQRTDRRHERETFVRDVRASQIEIPELAESRDGILNSREIGEDRLVGEVEVAERRVCCCGWRRNQIRQETTEWRQSSRVYSNYALLVDAGNKLPFLDR